MNIKYKKFLIISTIFILIGGVYLYISKDLNSENIVSVAYGSALSSSTGEDLMPPTLGSDIESDISFLTTLVSLKSINIDIGLFSNKSFNALVNNAVKIESVTPGRPNPFAPVGSTGILDNNNQNNIPFSNIVTDQATQITTTTAVLNGTVNIIGGVTNTYFKYGITENLGTVTPPVTQSLVGTFIKNVLGLTPQTTYFFKACAKVNNAELCGEVVSFRTN